MSKFRHPNRIFNFSNRKFSQIVNTNNCKIQFIPLEFSNGH